MKKYTLIMLTLILLSIASCGLVSDDASNELQSNCTLFLSIPEIDKNTPGENAAGTLGEYTFLSEQNGQKIAIIYSWEQINEINAKIDSGKTLSLSTEELAFIVEDTYRLFLENDIIRIRKSDGTFLEFYGASFYTSEEYRNYFNSDKIKYADASFDYKMDIVNAIYARMSILTSAVYDSKEAGKIVFSDTTEFDDRELSLLAQSYYNGLTNRASDSDIKRMQRYSVAAYYFDFADRDLSYCAEVASFSASSTISLTEPSRLPKWCAEYKYDILEKNVVVEVWDEHTMTLVRRLRIDENDMPNEFQELQSRINSVKLEHVTGNPANQDVDEFIDQIEKYRAVVYFNGIPFELGNCILYSPDGDINLFTPAKPADCLGDPYLMLQGAEPITEYINIILNKYMSIK